MRRLLVIATLLPLLACGSKRVSLTGEMRYGKSAEENYDAGLEEAKAERWDEASKLFEYVKTKYPFSKQAALADLQLADLKFRQELYAEAAAGYQAFGQLHPNHEQADYARFRVGLSLFKDAPGDFVLFPPPHEKDQRTLNEAVKALEGFLAAWPKSQYVPEAQKTLAEARGRLAEHEWYAAKFYASRGKWPGAAGRIETLLEKYPGTPREVEAMFMLADAYQRMGERFRAQQALQKLVATHPDDPRRPEAERLLAKLR
ncbi:MAG: outer membrane protein assembly factor BamD [Anaeromyxobacteraceae bacterium]